MDTQALITLSTIVTLSSGVILYQSHVIRSERQKARDKRENEIDKKFEDLYKRIEAAGLTERQKEILLLKIDKTNNEIAEIINRSVNTVKKISDQLHKKFDVHSQIELVELALALREKKKLQEQKLEENK